MYLKISGAVLIILATYLYGHNLSFMYYNRVRRLEELLMALEMFLTEVNYSLTPLPQAFISIGEKISRPVGGLFFDAAKLMQQNRGLSACECWRSAIKKNYRDLDLTRNNMDLLDRLGLIWGRSDKNGQQRQIALIQELLRQALGEAQVKHQKNEKICKYLGLLGGITLVLFLL
ncbi:MAG TPA: hypothetical protein GX004_09985 [Firmicutes bacterium]|jgi:stage III sporulation protein AB|nr:hypothetical protein [Bacillota bacterium]